jgi:dolichol-phosphate mannosyltransferase
MTIEKVVIILPVYNEAAVIQETITAVFEAVRNVSHAEIHVLVFDSASTDGTQNIVTDLMTKHDRLHMQTEPEKTGLGSAYLQAMRYAVDEMKADMVFEFDADLSHEPKYLVPMLDKIKHCDVVVGSRYVPGGSIPADWGWHRKFMSVLGNWIARVLLTFAYKDFTSGFRATRRAALQAVLPEKFISSQYAYKLQLFWLLHKNKSRICEYPIQFVDRKKGLSKLPANSVLDSLHVLFVLRFYEIKRYLKMCLVGVSGMTLQFLVYNLARHYFPPFFSQAIAVSAAIVNNFILNGLFTFKESSPVSHVDKVKSLLVFFVYSVGYIFLQSAWLAAGVKLLGTGLVRENGLLVTGMIFGSFLNYFIYSRIVWGPKR